MINRIVLVILLSLMLVTAFELLVVYGVLKNGPLCNRWINWHYPSEVFSDLAKNRITEMGISGSEYVVLVEYDHETKVLKTKDGNEFKVIGGFDGYSLSVSNTLRKGMNDGYVFNGMLYVNFCTGRFCFAESAGRQSRNLMEAMEKALNSVRFWKVLPTYSSGNQLYETKISVIKHS
jgi:hypothetical protein